MSSLLSIASKFKIASPTHIEPLGEGNINKTFRVKTTANTYVLQSLNTQIFSEPEKIVLTIQTLAKAQEEFLETLRSQGKTPDWEILRLVPTPSGKYLVREGEDVFRMFPFIEKGQTFQNLQGLAPEIRKKVAFELGRGWAFFHQSSQSIKVSELATILPHFHETKRVYAQFLELLDKKEKIVRSWSYELEEITQWVQDQKSLVEFAQNALSVLPKRVTHNDTKLNNCIFDPESFQVRSLIDLDTVQPGYVVFDVGDGLRSAANLAGEEEVDLSKVEWDVESFQQILNGYLENASFLTQEETQELPRFAQVLAFELGVRFLGDYLEGDPYFRHQNSQRPHLNLERAKVQFQLVKDFDKKADLLIGHNEKEP